MEIIPANSSLFRSSIEALKEFLPNATLRITSEGLRIQGMDASHVGFVDYYLARSDCTSIKLTKSLIIGMNMHVFARVLGNIGNDCNVSISLNKTQDKMIVSYVHEKANKKAHFEVPLLDISEDTFELPELTYAANINAKTADIYNAIKEVSHFGDSMTLMLDEDGFHISATGDIGFAKQTLDNTEDREMTLADEDTISATFGTKYLMGIMKSGSPLTNTIQLGFDPNQPMRAAFRFATDSHFIAYLAPKIIEQE